MPRNRLHLEGQRFGEWTIVDYAGQARWNAVCSCGRTGKPNTSNLMNGGSKCCQYCGERATRLPQKEAVYNQVIIDYRSNAQQRGRAYDLTREQAVEMLSANCYYCGAPPHQKRKNYPDAVYTGIDRVDNAKGYTYDNCLPCCTECNFAKGTRTQAEFLEWIRRVYQHNSE